MIEQTAPTIITCSVPGPRNNFGKPKLLVKFTEDGLHVWCKVCKTSHFIERARVIAAWERGESVQCEVAPDEQRV